ncbi:hypothetical protein B0H19DRAFT_1365108 [Mycena capillaripes]|nr:hypothetical protein B0H19DRAFT_1365108 [Mycena capillaripes]
MFGVWPVWRSGAGLVVWDVAVLQLWKLNTKAYRGQFKLRSINGMIDASLVATSHLLRLPPSSLPPTIAHLLSLSLASPPCKISSRHPATQPSSVQQTFKPLSSDLLKRPLPQDSGLELPRLKFLKNLLSLSCPKPCLKLLKHLGSFIHSCVLTPVCRLHAKYRRPSKLTQIPWDHVVGHRDLSGLRDAEHMSAGQQDGDLQW